MALPSTSTSPSEDMYLSDIINGAHGDRFQTDLALVIFERATRKGYDFRLGYEMAVADKFDDVAFLDKNENEWMLIQTKHTDTTKGTPAALKFDMLFPKDEATRDKGDFSLFKYLKSYVTVQASIEERKHIIIFTNRDFSVDSVEQLVEVELRQVDEILAFKQGRCIGLKVIPSMVKEMVDYVNRDFITLRDSIVKLFEDGIVNHVIKNFKTPIASILTKTNTGVKLSEKPPPEACTMLKSLGEIVNVQSAEIPLNKCNDIFTGKSRNKSMPIYVDENIVHNFFRDLVLYVRQPDDLREIINQDLRSWMRTWIRPDYLTRLEETQLHMCTVGLEDYFNNKQSPIVIDKGSYKKFMQLSDGKNLFKGLKKDLEKQLQNFTNFNVNDTSGYYINRQIEYISVYEEEPGCKQRTDQMRIRDDEFVDELYDFFINQRFLLILAEPGMGKSTILEYVALTAQQKSDDYVYFFDLGAFRQKLTLAGSTETIANFLSVFGTVLSEANLNSLIKTMKNKDNAKKHLFIFDALDEVFPQDRENILEMFCQMLEVPNVKILVSARKTVQSLVENKLKVKAMSLVPFDNRDQTNFLRKFWKVPRENDKSFQNYVGYLFKAFHSDINRALFKFTGLPLMLKMLAEVYADNFHEYLKEKHNLEALMPHEMFSIVHLYEKFVEKCFINKMTKKFINLQQDIDELEDILFGKFVSEHQLLAIKHLQIHILQFVFEDQEYLQTLNEFEKRIIVGTERSPLIEVSGNESRFIHLSYAEFFVAKFLVRRIEKYENKIFGTRSDAYLFDEYPMIRIFFFAMVEQQYKSEHLEILEKHYKKNNRIAIWACEVHGLKTVEFLLRTSCNSMIINQLLEVAAQHNCYGIYTHLLTNYQSFVNSNTHVRTPLHIAAEDGNMDVVKFLIQHSADVNAKKIDDYTPLHLAAKTGQIDIVKILIANSSDVNAKGNNDFTPLHFAAENGHLKVAQILIENCGDVNAKSNKGLTPLHLAAENGYLEVVQILINHFANINAKQINNGWTPLHYAAYDGHCDVLKVLIMHSGDVNAKTDFGSIPLHLASKNGHSEAVKILINHSDVNAKQNNDWTSLHHAAENGHSDVSKILLDHFGDVNAKNKKKATPLHLAAENGHSEIVKILIDHSANVNAKQMNDCTPLHYAASEGHLEVSKVLIDHSCNVNAKQVDGWAPLHLAAAEGHLEIVKILINHCGNVNAKAERDATPLHRAAFKGYLGIVKLLIECSANVNARESNGWTPLHFAALEGHIEVVKILIHHCDSVNAKTSGELTPLHYSAYKGHTEVVKMLLDHSGDVNAKDVDGWTPLFRAAQCGHMDVVKLITEHPNNSTVSTLLVYGYIGLRKLTSVMSPIILPSPRRPKK